MDGRARRVDGRTGISAAPRVPARVARLGGLALHFVHLGLYGEAQRSGPLDGGLPTVRGHDLPGEDWKEGSSDNRINRVVLCISFLARACTHV